VVEILSGPWGPLLIFGLRIVDVSLMTIRVLMVVRGKRVMAALLSFIEVIIWVLAAGAVIRNLASPWHAIGYAGGFAAGTAVGMWIESLLALGVCSVRAFSRDTGGGLVTDLREQGFGVTEQIGSGREGPVDILHAVVRRRDVRRVLELIDRHDPDAFVTIQNDAVVHRGWLLETRRR
jgi:uncharacterized protein YebE (UPF0316 family)